MVVLNTWTAIYSPCNRGIVVGSENLDQYATLQYSLHQSVTSK